MMIFFGYFIMLSVSRLHSVGMMMMMMMEGEEEEEEKMGRKN
jgi:hypothetical protein